MARLQKIIRCTAAAALTLALSVGIASAAYGTGTVTASSLRLRSEASTASSTLTIVPRGTEVQVLEEMKDGWYKVDCDGMVGYMFADYLTVEVSEVSGDEASVEDAVTGEAPVEPEDTAAEENDDTIYARVTASVLNVRSGPGTDYSRIDKISAGHLVVVLSSDNGWARISYDGEEGFVSEEYLNVIDMEAVQAAATEGARLAELAKQYLGVPYVYGGASPSGFDCSGLVYYLTKTMGYSVPRTATAQWNAGYDKVSRSELQPGDLVFFTNTYHSSKYITHVGIYIGDGNFIHASSPTSGGVIITSLSQSYYSTRFVGGCRIF